MNVVEELEKHYIYIFKIDLLKSHVSTLYRIIKETNEDIEKCKAWGLNLGTNRIIEQSEKFTKDIERTKLEINQLTTISDRMRFIIQSLDPEEQQVIDYTYNKNLSYSSIGGEIKLSRSTIHRIKHKSLLKIELCLSVAPAAAPAALAAAI